MSGEYRSIYSTLPDDDAFIMLSPIAKTVWYTLKMKLPVIGIGRMNPRVLATLVNCTTEELAAAEAELSPKWLQRDGLTWWLTGALRFQPLLTVRNPKHRAFVEKQLAAVPNSALRNAFHQAYPDWFPSAGKATGTVSDGYQYPSDTQSIDSDIGVEKEPDDDSNRSTVDSNTVNGKRDITPAVVSAAALALSVVANKGLGEHASRPQLIPRIIGTSGASHVAAEAILQAGVPLAFAESQIYEHARTHDAEGVVSSLKYFTQAVVRAWRQSLEAESAKNRAPPKRNGSRSKPPANQNTPSSKYADHFK